MKKVIIVTISSLFLLCTIFSVYFSKEEKVIYKNDIKNLGKTNWHHATFTII